MPCLWYKTVPWRHSELNKRRTYPGNIEDLLEVIRPYMVSVQLKNPDGHIHLTHFSGDALRPAILVLIASCGKKNKSPYPSNGTNTNIFT